MKNNLIKLLKLWVPVLAWAGLIFYLSSIPDLKTSLEYDFVLRKIAHAAEYFILTFLLYRAFKGQLKMGTLLLIIYPATLSFLYAASDEFHQSFVIGRTCSFGDVLIDTIGIISFFIVIQILTVKQKSR